jgi:hypothetical protein
VVILRGTGVKMTGAEETSSGLMYCAVVILTLITEAPTAVFLALKFNVASVPETTALSTSKDQFIPTLPVFVFALAIAAGFGPVPAPKPTLGCVVLISSTKVLSNVNLKSSAPISGFPLNTTVTAKSPFGAAVEGPVIVTVPVRFGAAEAVIILAAHIETTSETVIITDIIFFLISSSKFNWSILQQP